jgi:hypothetical protein
MSSVISPVTGTRTEPKDTYLFVRGTTATFKTIFISDGRPTVVDTGSQPRAVVLQPLFLNLSGSTIPAILADIYGTLVPGQQYEYQFQWDIPPNTVQLDEYIISYSGILGGVTYSFGDEYLTITAGAGTVGLQDYSYATVSDVRMQKFDLDDHLPEVIRKDVIARNNIIEYHLRNAATKLREELSLHRARGNTENYRLFCIYYTIWSILLASRGQDGSSVSDSNLTFWRSEWQDILDQEKRRSVAQGLPLGRG